jgi:hypothetical protein
MGQKFMDVGAPVGRALMDNPVIDLFMALQEGAQPAVDSLMGSKLMDSSRLQERAAQLGTALSDPSVGTAEGLQQVIMGTNPQLNQLLAQQGQAPTAPTDPEVLPSTTPTPSGAKDVTSATEPPPSPEGDDPAATYQNAMRAMMDIGAYIDMNVRHPRYKQAHRARYASRLVQDGIDPYLVQSWVANGSQGFAEYFKLQTGRAGATRQPGASPDMELLKHALRGERSSQDLRESMALKAATDPTLARQMGAVSNPTMSRIPFVKPKIDLNTLMEFAGQRTGSAMQAQPTVDLDAVEEAMMTLGQ